MKVLITSREALLPTVGGHREYLLETIKGLASYGVSVHVLSWGKEKNYTYNKNNIIEHHYNSSSYQLIDKKNSKFIKNLGSSIGISQIFTILDKGLSVNNTNSYIKTDYDIIIKNGPDSNMIANYISKKQQIPVIERLDWVGLPYRSEYYKSWLNYINEHYLPYNYFTKPFDKLLTKCEAISAKADYIYTHTKRDMLKISKYVDLSKLSYLNPFLNSVTSNETQNFNDVIGKKYILFYSTLSINSCEAIKYIYKISKLHFGLKFVITGNFYNLGQQFLRENLIFLGELPIDKFYSILKNAYLVIFPLTMGHGIQMKLIRAFSFSKAIIANDGILEPLTGLVNNNENIIIGKTPFEFLDKLLYLYEDENLIDRIGKNAYKVYQEYFFPEKNIKKLKEYLELCKNKYIAP